MLNKILIISFFSVYSFGRVAEALACSVCYGTKASSMTDALNMAILSLLFILLGVLSCVGVFFLKVRKKLSALEN